MNGKYKSLDEIIRTYLQNKELLRGQSIDNDWWWASELGTCKRKQFLRRLGVPSKPKEWRISFLGEQGRMAHEWIARSVKEMGCLIAVEGELKDEKLRYKGRFDLIVDLNPGVITEPYYSLVDVKTQRPEAFFRRMRSAENDKVKRFQKMQLASYFYFAKQKEEFKFLKDARIYYLDRGGGVRDEFIFQFSKKIFNEILEELKDLNEYWTKKQLPPCNHNWECKKWCDIYKKECRELERGILSLEEFKNATKIKVDQNI